jgi:hypothetical protein
MRKVVFEKYIFISRYQSKILDNHIPAEKILLGDGRWQ